MPRLALLLAAAAVVAAVVAAPGQYLGIGLGIGGIGTGWLAFTRRGAAGVARLAGAAAITVGALGCLLGIVRVAIALAAIGHIDQMVR